MTIYHSGLPIKMDRTVEVVLVFLQAPEAEGPRITYVLCSLRAHALVLGHRHAASSRLSGGEGCMDPNRGGWCTLLKAALSSTVAGRRRQRL